ncbi:MAG TPA: DUF2071 domain-containing protein [Planctomycetota bacterium]|nr:DUF2071 domain-containing protein [Planctomycetota bacterium]
MNMFIKASRPAEGSRPWFRLAWGETTFLHFEADPSALRSRVPRPLDLYQGRAYVSVVAITVRRGWAAQSFLNVRTYVEGGITFLGGWLSNPLGVVLGARLVGIPYRRARISLRSAVSEVHLRARRGGRSLEFRAKLDPRQTYGAPRPGSLDEFLLERYSAYTRAGRRRLSFRVWHEPWRIVRIDPELEENGLLETTGGWLREARLACSHHSPGFDQVGMGCLERVRA